MRKRYLSLSFLLAIVLLFLQAGTLRAQAKSPSYEVYALKFASRTQTDWIGNVAIGAKDQDSVGVIFMYWLLKGSNGKVVLVDAGFADDFEINPRMIVYTRPDEVLKRLDVQPEAVTDIIVTHPHWDHIGGIDLFPQAMVWMQEADYNYFVGQAWQPEGNKMGFNEHDVRKVVDRNVNGLLTLVKGDNQEILPGIKVYIGSKHTCESQYVAVGQGNDNIIIASDNAWYYYNLTHLLPIPITHDAKAYTANLKRMRSMVKDVLRIIPGHDPLVFSKYPQVAQDVVKISR